MELAVLRSQSFFYCISHLQSSTQKNALLLKIFYTPVFKWEQSVSLYYSETNNFGVYEDKSSALLDG